MSKNLPAAAFGGFPLLFHAFLAAFWGTLKKKEGITAAAEQRMFRLTSLLQLVVPHLLILAVYLLNTLTAGLFEAAVGLPLTHPLFLCTYAVVVSQYVALPGGMVKPHAPSSLRNLLDAAAENLSAPLQNFVQIADAPRVYALLQQLLTL